MRIDPSARIPASNMSAYISSTPRAPLDPGTAEFIKGKPAIVQPAEMSVEQFKAEAKSLFKNMDTDFARMLAIAAEFKRRWREFGATRTLACDEVFGCSTGALSHKISYWSERLVSKIRPDITEEEDKQNSLERIAALPPLAEPAPTPPTETFAQRMNRELAESMQEMPKVNGHKAPEPRKNNGKAAFMLPVWKELSDGFGKLLNRADEANRAIPDKVEHAGMLACLKDGMERVERWQNKGRA